MAANTFATKLSRNTNRITVILVYAFLEWLLMFFIFLNSLFTCFLVKFASFFGLKQICLLCPNLHQIFDRNPENRLTYRELLCPNHVAELASLSFCKTHGKVTESVSLCSDCSDREDKSNIGLGFCSCCEKSLGERHYPSYLLIKSSVWGKTLVDRENRGLILEMIDDDKIGDGFEIGRESDSFFREKPEEEANRGEQHQQNGEVISDVDSYGVSLREVSEEDGLRSINSNHFLGNEDEILEAEPRVSEDEQRDDEDVEDVAIEGEDKTSGCVEEGKEEIEREVLLDDLDDQHVSKNEAFVSEDLSVGVDPVVTGIQNEEEDQEEKTKEYPETPTSESSLLHKKLLFLSKNDYAAAEDAREVSIAVSDTDGEDPIRTIERLKETVRSEQEALRGLYAELEEERSASAIAANQTMAMITRLQEEKAKVQMEALQYQRMMEEQAEYDQEALQLLNHLMVKREKEKEELQRELDVCRAKVLQYEKNKTKCEANDDDDDDDDDDSKEENGEEDNCSETDVDLEKITLDCVKHMGMLDESLSEFEEERLVILDQLKVLEDRLLTMQDKESAEGSKFQGEFSNSYEGESYEHEEGLTMASMAKSLLPLLDAAENESEDEYDQEQQESVEKNVSSESEKLEIIKQVDSVYERLQVLETDGEFMKNCMSSPKKGDNGTDLLQDILQHLRDLRNIELTDTIENQTTHEE